MMKYTRILKVKVNLKMFYGDGMCFVCDRTFATQKAMLEHLGKHTDKELADYL